MTTRPILFSGPMVRAILAGAKSQTRRVVNMANIGMIGHGGTGDDPESWGYQIDDGSGLWAVLARGHSATESGLISIPCPYGAPGERLWVRETFRIENGTRPEHGPNGVHYRADGEDSGATWRPSIFMPRWISRLTLDVTEIRVERLGALTYDDAQAEGVDFFPPAPGCSPVQRFALGWDKINGKRGFPWASNPWVWVVAFRRVAA